MDRIIQSSIKREKILGNQLERVKLQTYLNLKGNKKHIMTCLWYRD